MLRSKGGKSKGKWIIISLAVILGALCGCQSSGSDPIEMPDFSSADIGDTTEGSDNDASADENVFFAESHSKSYELGGDVMDAQFSFIYKEDTVVSMTGFLSIYDTSAVDISEFQKNVETTQNFIEEYGLDSMSFQMTENDMIEYGFSFAFHNLDSDETAAQLAASYCGISVDEGRIRMSTVEKAMDDYGYIFKEQHY